MRTMDRKDQEQHEADELASEAFDRYLPEIEQWVRDAFVGEWGDAAEKAAKGVMWAAVRWFADGKNDSWLIAGLYRSTYLLRDAYVEHASAHGLYAAEAADAVNNAISDEAERARDLADDRNVDAYNAALRG
jgi:hypothetical protein